MNSRFCLLGKLLPFADFAYQSPYFAASLKTQHARTLDARNYVCSHQTAYLEIQRCLA
jgi:hypothetical protein